MSNRISPLTVGRTFLSAYPLADRNVCPTKGWMARGTSLLEIIVTLTILGGAFIAVLSVMHFLGGAMSINPDLARQSIEPLARAMNKSITETALGILRIAEANMTSALRAVTARRGHDPRKFTLVSFGGAGGLHACALADGLEIPRVLVPPYAGVLSALGMVVAPPIVDVSRTVVHLSATLTPRIRQPCVAGSVR